MKIFPAIDILGGQVVRLTQGDYAQKAVYAHDPEIVARTFAQQGARNLHVVDLDGARDGSPVNIDAIGRVARVEGLFLEVGGGIRDVTRVEAYLNLGVDRVILGTAAIRDPAFTKDMLRRFGARIAIGVDARDGFVAISGWLETTNVRSVAFCRALAQAGASTVIYTDIAKDGGLGGTNLDVYRALSQIPDLAIVASGGISSRSDITALKEMGISAAIVGKAIYEGRITLTDALEAGADVC